MIPSERLILRKVTNAELWWDCEVGPCRKKKGPTLTTKFKVLLFKGQINP